ncbi:hypothetical protein vseg_001723 [Gypsophila vaccaria]
MKNFISCKTALLVFIVALSCFSSLTMVVESRTMTSEIGGVDFVQVNGPCSSDTQCESLHCFTCRPFCIDGRCGCICN